MRRRPRSASRRLSLRGFSSHAAAEVLESRTLLTAYVVDSLADTVAADGQLTLREAILAANGNAAVNEAAAGQGGGATDTITFAASITGGTVTLGGAPLLITDHLVIGGPVTVNGNGLSRVFSVSGAAVAMTGLTVTGGRVVGNGAGIVVVDGGALTMTACLVTANVALLGQPNEGITGQGGGVSNVLGSLTLVGCGVTGNGGGAAVYGVEGPISVSGSVVADNDAGVTTLGSLDLRDSAVRDNRGRGVDCGLLLTAAGCVVTGNAGFGILTGAWDASVVGCVVSGNGGFGIGVRGDLTVEGSTVSGNAGTGISGGRWLAVSNSTISGNRSLSGGAGIALGRGAAVLRNVTVFGNRSDADGSGDPGTGGISAGSDFSSARFMLFNTLVAGNVRGAGGAATPSDLFAYPAGESFGGSWPASTFGGGHNLIGDATTAGGFVDGVGGNVVGVDWRAVLDPALKNNGGPTPTHALVAGSPAIGAGRNAEALGAVDDTQQVDAAGPLLYDQRGPGYPRVLGERVDIGAFEAAAADDLIEYSTFAGGEWRVWTRGDAGFAGSVWADWPNASWTALAVGDFDGDGRADALGLTEGAWFVGLSTGSSFGFERWGVWSDAAWENVLVGDLDGDGRDDVLAEVGGEWWGALSTGTGFGTPAKWGGTSDAAWELATLADMTGDGRDDLVLFARGEWYVAASGGAAAGLGPARLWARWADAAWAVRLGDFNADGLTDVVGLLRGEWYLGGSTGAGFTTVLRARWADAAWADPVVGDFDGDGRDDVAARVAGEWWVGLSDVFGYEWSRAGWATWRDVDWRDVRVGDFDGDGRDDIAARVVDEWYLARSTGAAFATEAIGRSPGGKAAFAADATGPPSPAAASVAAGEDDEPLAVFWRQIEEDKAFAGLLAGRLTY